MPPARRDQTVASVLLSGDRYQRQSPGHSWGHTLAHLLGSHFTTLSLRAHLRSGVAVVPPPPRGGVSGLHNTGPGGTCPIEGAGHPPVLWTSLGRWPRAPLLIPSGSPAVGPLPESI